MNRKDLIKEIRLNNHDIKVIERAEGENEASKMILEGYPIVFDVETFIGWGDQGFYEKIDRNAFSRADMTDVCLKYNHNDDFLILARTRNGSLTLKPDEKGVFMHAELIDTTTNRDVYKMVEAGLLTEGSFAFTVSDETEEIVNSQVHRTITGIDFLYDISICPNGAYGSATSIVARNKTKALDDAFAKVDSLKRMEILKLRNKNKLKFFGGK